MATVANSFLAPNQCLVYIEDRRPFAYTEGIVYVAEILRSYRLNEKLWFDVLLETSPSGDKLSIRRPCTISGNNVVSNRPPIDVQPREMYHFTQGHFTEESANIDYPIIASNFVIKKNLNPIAGTSRSALGSGIYCRYVGDATKIPSLLVNPKQTVYLIDCPNAYIIQDKEHGLSISFASTHTNQYMDRIIISLQGIPEVDYETALAQIHATENSNLITLWNIALYRTQDTVTQTWLEDILAQYAVGYLNGYDFVDTVNDDLLQELPINDIMRGLGYTGLLASDLYSNGWDRGCVSYYYDQASIIQGSTSKY
jgi:hypothetical protein